MVSRVAEWTKAMCTAIAQGFLAHSSIAVVFSLTHCSISFSPISGPHPESLAYQRVGGMCTDVYRVFHGVKIKSLA